MNAQIESFERRALLSAWGTSDDFQPPGGGASAYAITNDAAGTVYAAGAAGGADGITHFVVREKAAGVADWATTLDTTSLPFDYGVPQDIAVARNGDVYMAGRVFDQVNSKIEWVVVERKAGQQGLSVVDRVPIGSNPPLHFDLAADAAGNVFSAGVQRSTVTAKRTTTTVDYWTVRKQSGGSGLFQTVDSFSDPTSNTALANGVSVIDTGPAAGVYVVGQYGTGYTSRWMVRRSTDGGATWATVDSFQLDPVNNARAYATAVAGDAVGNVYAVGVSDKFLGGRTVDGNFQAYWTVRKSVGGGSGTWNTVDTYRPSSLDSRLRPRPTDVAAAPNDGGVYVVGTDDGNMRHGVLRSNTGAGWVTEEFHTVPGQSSEARRVVVDPAGNVFAAGVASDAGAPSHWLVRSRSAATSATASTFSTSPIVVLSSSSSTSEDQPTLAQGILA
jgi:hypothetical protein